MFICIQNFQLTVELGEEKIEFLEKLLITNFEKDELESLFLLVLLS